MAFTPRVALPGEKFSRRSSPIRPRNFPSPRRGWYISERKGVDEGVTPGSEFAFPTGGFSGRRKREKAPRNGVYVRFKVDRTTSKRIRYGFITVKSTTLIGLNSPRKNTTLPAISSNSPIVISPSTRRLPVKNDCPRLEEKKNDNSPVVLSTGTHRLLVMNGCPRLDGRGKKTMSGAS
ncbi:hypothetical protein TNCV_3291341 [Trichonephila clavipes]|nr:hypothetical protein TNCV_3291341 [Trichonephila clavipes]